MRILAIISGDYGIRHVENIRTNGPQEWVINTWKAPSIFPLIIDYPEDYIPDDLPETDLILSFAEHRGVAELLPDIAKQTKAQAVIAGVDNEAWLPRGLARQLRGWLLISALRNPNHFGVTAASAWHIQPAHFELRSILSALIYNQCRSRKHNRICWRGKGCRCGCARMWLKDWSAYRPMKRGKAGLLHHHFLV
jgi:hypothetical protein